MKMKVKNCTECEFTKTCRSYYGGLGCKMKEEDQGKKKSERSIIEIQDITPYFTESLKQKKVIEAARLVERNDGSRAVEIKFYDHIPKTERIIRILAIGENLLNMCAEMDMEESEEHKPFLDFMDGAQIKEWVEEPEENESSCNGCFGAANGDCEECGDTWKNNIMKRFTETN